MQRRNFLLLAMAGMGVTVTPMTSKAFAKSRSGVRPVGIAVANAGGNKFVSRCYPGDAPTERIIRLQTPNGVRFMKISVPRGINRAFRGFLRDGLIPAVLSGGTGPERSVDVHLKRIGSNIEFSSEFGALSVLGQAAGSGNKGGGDGGTEALGFLGALVAIVAMLVALEAYAIHEGVHHTIKFRCTGAGCNLEMHTSPTDLTEEDGDGFMADPSCEGLPPLPC